MLYANETFVRSANLVNTSLCTPLGLILNIFLIWVVVDQSEKEIKVYDRVLIQTCLNDILLLITTFFCQPSIYCWQNTFVTMLNSPLRYQPTWLQAMVYNVWFWSLFFTICAFSVQFFYRYLAVCKQKTVSYLAYFGMLSIPGAILAVLFTFSFFMTYPDGTHTYLENPVYLELLEGPDWANHPKLPVAAYAFNSLEYKIWAFCLNSLLGLSVAIIVVYQWKFYKYLKDHMNRFEQSKIRQISKQVSTVLVIQTALPTVIGLLGMFCWTDCISTNEGTNKHFCSHIVLMLNIWPSVLNPLVTISFVKKYRRFCCTQLSKFLSGCCTTLNQSLKNVKS